MEITDTDYMDELLCGIESKLGASIPQCLLQPMITSTSSSTLSAPICEGGHSLCSTPMGSVNRLGLPTSLVCSTPVIAQQNHGVSDSSAPFTIMQPLSPVKQLAVRHRKLQESCSKLKSGMNALRAVDISLMRQHLTIYDAIEELRWMMESYDMSDSCESINSSVCESIEQIHEKWMTERRQWQSVSSRDLSNWKDDSRFNINYVGRLNSAGSRMQAIGEKSHAYGLSLQATHWRSPQKEMNSSFPQFTPGRSNFERQRRSSVDHLPIVPSVEPSQSSPITTRKRRSSSGALEAGVAEKNEQEQQEQTEESTHRKKPKFLFHSKSSPAFESQLQWVEVTDTAMI